MVAIGEIRWFILCLIALVTLVGGPAFAQLGVPNPPAVSPEQFATTPPFGARPNPLNNSHVTQPWDFFHTGLVVRELQVLPRMIVVPMEAAQPGSLPSTLELQQVTLPGFRVTETVAGYIVDEHWEVRAVGSAYYWTFVPTHFRSK
jgi:hypothetical protein